MMKTNILTKEQFVKIIKDLEIASDFQDKVNEMFYGFGCNAPEFPSLYEAVVDTLNVMFDLDVTKEYGSDIDYFCIELEFGRKYIPGIIKDENGNEIDLSTVEKLYDYIIKKD